MHRIALLHLVLLLFIGNIGVRIFTHSCREDGTFKSYFLELNNHCSNKGNTVLPTCCQRKFDSQPIQQLKEECCKSMVSVFKIKNSYNHQKENCGISFDLNTVGFIDKSFKLCFQNQKLKELSWNLRPPPSQRVKSIIIQYQVFRI